MLVWVFFVGFELRMKGEEDGEGEGYLYPNVQVYSDMFCVDYDGCRLVNRHDLVRFDIVL